MWLRVGYWPNIRNPQTFNEKIAHRQLFTPHQLAPFLADKWRVRKYVAERGFADILNEVYYVTEQPETIPFDDLPDKFVIKANHGCGLNIFVTDKKLLNREKTIKHCQNLLTLKYGRWRRNYELHYDNIPPLIMVERYIEDKNYGFPLDYKFFCFHGVVHYIQVDFDRFTRHTRIIYDKEWKDTGIMYAFPRPLGKSLSKPYNFNDMVIIAEKLSSGIDFCRVDLYNPAPDKIIFSEITFNPEGALGRFVPKEFDWIFGKLW